MCVCDFLSLESMALFLSLSWGLVRRFERSFWRRDGQGRKMMENEEERWINKNQDRYISLLLFCLFFYFVFGRRESVRKFLSPKVTFWIQCFLCFSVSFLRPFLRFLHFSPVFFLFVFNPLLRCFSFFVAFSLLWLRFFIFSFHFRFYILSIYT